MFSEKKELLSGALSSFTSIMGRMAFYSAQVDSREDGFNVEEGLVLVIADWTDVPPVKPDSQMVYPYSVPGGSNKYLW